MRRTFVIWHADHEICGHCLSVGNRRMICIIRWVRSSVRNLAHWRSTPRIVKAKFVRLNSELFSEMGEYVSGEPRSVT
ncbi:hypothetical protein ALC56_02615 [Trachymyrmex septentrionalis]|uniref:Uncharacterized protein n=2 Tax=Trachymyrmex TaxID=34717 RepID=A0A195FQR7_9HYME|nr:hypothetical protein ALC56_02615 [Trachymyrmex septentrionalis]KYN50473.1 hypothetical protein ALC57_00110 [Trachymyrmex cornetzi]